MAADGGHGLPKRIPGTALAGVEPITEITEKMFLPEGVFQRNQIRSAL